MSDERIDLSKVFIGVPCGTHHIHIAAAGSVFGASGWSGSGSPCIRYRADSLLPRNFNALLVQAASEGAQWFAMHHADVAADAGWLTTMIELAEHHKADVLSAVIPLKNHTGVTSTAVARSRPRDDGIIPEIERLTVRQIAELPDVFDSGDVGGPLLVNTGLMLVRMGKWIIDFPGFQFIDRIDWTRRADGSYHADVRCLPEDWGFSYWAHARGLQVMATRAVAVHHWGEAQYANKPVWGTWSRDEAFEPTPQNPDPKPPAGGT